MKRLGTVLVFKPGIDPATAKSAIKWLEAVLDPDYHIPLDNEYVRAFSKAERRVVAEDGNKVLAVIEPFDDDHGGPVFYVP